MKKSALKTVEEEEGGWLNALLLKTVKWDLGWGRWVILSISLVLLIIGFFCVDRVQVGDYHPGSPLLWPDSVYNHSVSQINKKFAGVDNYYVGIRGKDAEGIKYPEILKGIEAFSRNLYQHPSFGGAQSFVDVVKKMNKEFSEGDPKWERIPETKEDVGMFIRMYEFSGDPGDFNRYASVDYRNGNIVCFFRDHMAVTVKECIRLSKEFIDSYSLPHGAKFDLAGGLIGTTAATNEELERSNLTLLIMVYLGVFVLCSIFYRSPIAGLMLVVPLWIANLLTFVFMIAVKMGLNVNSLPVSCIGAGIGVDYGIYMLSRIREETRMANGDLKKGIARAKSTTGKALIFTALTILFSLIFWYFSPIRFQAEVGLLLVIIFSVNLLGALIIVPSLAFIIKPKFLKG